MIFKKRCFAGLALALALVLSICPARALADGGTLTLGYAYDGVEFQIYRAAETNGTLTEAFAGCAVALSDADTASEKQKAAAALADYADTNGITPTAVEKTANGNVIYYGLEAGTYLVTGSTHRSGGYTYAPVPFVIYVTSYGTVTADVKYDRSGGDGDADDNDSDDDSDDVDDTDDADYDISDNDTDNDDADDNNADDEDSNSELTPPDEPSLPQTGQLWWPVLLLAEAGVVLLLLGRRKDDEK